MIWRETVHEMLYGAVRDGRQGLRVLPGLIRQALESRVWEERIVAATRERVEFHSFAEYVTTEPPDGLGADLDLIRRMVKDDPQTLDSLDAALKNPASLHAFNNVQGSAPVGNSEEAALRRLRKDRPDLHTQVLAGELSAHGAAVKAGFRPRTITVPIDSPERIARTLIRHLTDDQLLELIQLLEQA